MAEKDNKKDSNTKSEELKKLLSDNQYTKLPKEGDLVEGKVIAISRSGIHVDIDGVATGVIRGRELYNELAEYSDLKVGDKVEATVLELENENGELELSFRFAGQQKVWDKLQELMDKGEAVEAKINEATKGGLIATVNRIKGFLPVSQLSPENYPRVPGGDKGKILDKLKQLTGKIIKVKVIDVNQRDEKLIVSEKAIWEEQQKDVIDKYKIGDIIEGEVKAVTDFGVFIGFGEGLEGLVHISEIAWQRLDHPSDVVKVGDKVKAEIINIEGSKIFLSMRKIQDDPWKDIEKKYKVGQKVKGTVLKANPFGLFVELDKDIHGLAHISELSDKPVTDPSEIAKSGDEVEFKIVSIEPDNHRLGLSIRALKESAKAKAEDKEQKNKKTKEQDDQAEDKKTENIKEEKVEKPKAEESKEEQKIEDKKEEKKEKEE